MCRFIAKEGVHNNIRRPIRPDFKDTDADLPPAQVNRRTYSPKVLGIVCGVSLLIVALSAGHQEINTPVIAYTGGAHALSSANVSLLEAVRNPHVTSTAQGGGDVVVVGGALVADAGPLGTQADIVEGKNNGEISLYVVREGDTLSQIGEMFDVSVNTIRWANDIEYGEEIQPGDALAILPITGIKHTVKKGDTLSTIAKKYNADSTEIRSYNGLSSDRRLAVGDVVIIPHGEIEAPAPAVRSTPRGVSGGGPTYAGYYMRPIAGGQRSQGIHGYNAVDLATYAGAEIYASAAGRVIISKNAGWNGGYGNYVVIKHDNGTQTLYAHNARNNVSVGQIVSQGQVIGYVGSTGRSTGAHVHFEIRGARNPF